MSQLHLFYLLTKVIAIKEYKVFQFREQRKPEKKNPQTSISCEDILEHQYLYIFYQQYLGHRQQTYLGKATTIHKLRPVYALWPVGLSCKSLPRVVLKTLCCPQQLCYPSQYFSRYIQTDKKLVGSLFIIQRANYMSTTGSSLLYLEAAVLVHPKSLTFSLCLDSVVGSFKDLVDFSSTDYFIDLYFAVTHKLPLCEIDYKRTLLTPSLKCQTDLLEQSYT